MQKLNREIGSSFYSLANGDKELTVLKQQSNIIKAPLAYFYSGRNAIHAILNEIFIAGRRCTIWLPSYYCDTVVNLIENHFNNVAYYPVNPFEFDHSVNIEAFAKPNDVIIINNFWGLSSFNHKSDTKHNIIIVEDHSHGWLSEQCLNSNADYCFSSLRKTYPIPLGAVVWKPKSKKPFNHYNIANDEAVLSAHTNLNTSLTLKRQYIKNNGEKVKNTFLKHLYKGEQDLNNSQDYTKPDLNLEQLLKSFVHIDPNAIKNENLAFITKKINPSKHFKVLNKKGHTPFGLLLVFKNINTFNAFKICMINQNIYPAHLWPNTTINGTWKYLLNIHIDFRYDIEDMSYLVEKINLWTKNNV